jgi:hypothetical protein
MMRSKLGLIGLCVAVLGVMAFSASAAQAETGANWLILTSGGAVKTGGELHAILSSKTEGFWRLLSQALGLKLAVLCTAGTLVGVSLEGSGSLTNGGKARLTGCTVDLNGTPSPECEVHSPGQPVGTVETTSLKGLMVLTSGKPVIRVEPKEGETIINMNMGEECPIGENIPVRGPFDYIDCEGAIGIHLVTHLFEMSSGPWILNKTAEHMVGFSGSMLFFLEGAHSGLRWSGDPA